MRILIADRFDDDSLATIEHRGHAVTLEPGLEGASLAAALAGIQILIVRSTLVTAEILSHAADLALIVRAGAGTNTIDTQAAADRGIFVSNVPGRNAVAVAELTLGLILAIDRRIPDNVTDIRNGVWNKKGYSKGLGLKGRQLGIVGLGAIGREVAMRADAFGMHLVGLAKPRDSHTRELLDDLGFAFTVDLKTLASQVDILSFHVPAAPETKHLIDADLLGVLQPGSVIVNTSRSDVMDEEAVLEALDTQDFWLGIDVFADEPSTGAGTVSSAIAAHPRVYATHHIGASTAQAQAAVAEGVVDVVDAFSHGEIVNCVNLESEIPGTLTLTVRHLDRVGVLAGLLSIIRDAGLNVEHMTNRVLLGATAASATIAIRGDWRPELVNRLKEVDDVISVRINE